MKNSMNRREQNNEMNQEKATSNIKNTLYDDIVSFKDKVFSVIQGKEDHDVTYGDLATDIRKCMAMYAQLPKEGNLGLWASAGYETTVAVLAAFLTGRLITIIDGALQWDLAYPLLKRADVRTIICRKEKAEIENLVNMKMLALDDYKEFEPMPEDSMPRVDMHHPTFLLYTSGTTGISKGVVLSFYSLWKQSEWLLEAGGTDAKVFLTILPCHHIFSFLQLIYVIRSGSKLVFSRGANLLLEDMVKYQPSFFLAVPVVASTMLEVAKKMAQEKEEAIGLFLKRITGGSLKFMVIGGAMPDYSIYKYFDAAGIWIAIGYGLTESCGPAALDDRFTRRVGSVGKLGRFFDYKIEDGEVLIKSDILFQEYYKDPQETERAFKDGWFCTGDLGHIEDGYLYITGRKKNLIILGNGENVSPEELENYVHGCEDLDDVLVKQEGEVICAEIYSHLYGLIDERELLERINGSINSINESLPAYKKIAKVKVRKVPLQRNRTGKIIRGIQEDNSVYVELSDNISTEISDTEKLVCALYSDILNLSTVTTKDSFFALGGNSLRAARLVQNIEQETGVALEVKDVFTAPTPKMLAGLIDEKAKEKNEFKSIPVASAEKYYQMSSNQKRMYMLWTMKPESVAYNCPVKIKLCRKADMEKVEKALYEMQSLHESLRTRYSMINTEFVQEILNPENAYHEFSYLNDVDSDEKEIEKAFIRPFKLDEGNVIRALLVDRKDGQILYFDMHHIATDGMSYNIFMEEFWDIYYEKPLSHDIRQYKDYSEWMQTRDLTPQRDYWLDQFQEEPPVLDMPTDFVRPKEQSFVGASISRNIGPKLTQRIHDFCNQAEVTEYMFLLSALMVLLGKYGRQEDVVIGSGVNERTHRDLSGMIGMLVNTLPMRGRPGRNKNYLAFLNEIKENCLNAYANREYPLEELVEQVVDQRDTSRNPLFDVMLTLQNNEMPSIDAYEMITDVEEMATDSSMLDLSFEVTERDKEYAIRLIYCSDLFLRDSAERILARYERLLSTILDNPDQMICEFSMIDENERQIILKEFNDTAAEYPRDRTVAELFEEQVRKTPDKTAVVFEDRSLTYAGLNGKANALARRLRRAGVGPDAFVAVVAERGMEILIGILATLKAGGAYVPVDPSYPEERIRYMLEDCRPKAILTCQAGVPSLPDDAAVPVIDLAGGDAFEGRTDDLKVRRRATDLAYCIYTSGTTGQPKGSVIENRSILRLVKGVDYVTLDGHTVMLQTGSMSFDASTLEVWGTLLNGGRLVLGTREAILNGESLKDLIARERVNTMWMTSTLFNQMISDDGSTFDGLEHLLIGGEKLSDRHVRMLKERPGRMRLTNGYGPTENTTFTTTYEIPDGFGRIPIGRPVPNTQVYIVDGENLCGIGVPGELCTSGDGLARGYLNRPELTAEKFVDNPFGEGRMYRTGDLARWLPDGNVEYLGRMDEQVKIRGFRIELGEIESRLRDVAGVRDCAVIAREDASGDKAVYAYVVGDGAIDLSAVRGELGKTLPDYMIPSYLKQIDGIPVTRNGKLDRRALPEIEGGIAKEYAAPRNETEEVICECFGEILNVERVGVRDGFFELGGHSLRATRLVNLIEERTGHRLALKEVFSHPTPERMAELITGAPAEEYEPIPKAEERECYPMSSAQKRTYLICQMDPEGIAYNMPQSMRLTGEVRPEAMREALQKLIDRHEILRTRFTMAGGELVQQILGHVEADFAYEKDLTTPEEELVNGFARPFDLSSPPLVRVRLVDRGEYHLLSIDMHHIVSDGMSMTTFGRELGALYNGEELKPLTRQFRDYSEWMRGRDLSGQEAYWKGQFEDEIPVLDLPLDHARPQEQSFEGATVRRGLGKELTEGIRRTASAYGATEFMVLMSATMILLSKYGRQEDVVVGTPISGRTHRDTEGMLGMFVNTLAMRGRPEAGKTYEAFLKEVKEASLKAYENQEYPFEELVEAVEVRRDVSRNPLFDVMMVLQNNESVDVRLSNVESEYAEAKMTIAKLDLTFHVFERDGEYVVGLEYCTALFDRESMERMLVHFGTILEQVTAHPGVTLASIETASANEKTRILKEFNDTAAEYPRDRTVAELFEERVRKTPDEIAVAFGDQTLTYAELNDRANALARRLRDLGARPNDFVAILARRSLEMVIAIYGVVKSGAAYVPVDPTYPKDRIDYILEDSDPKAVLVYEEEIVTEKPVIDLADAGLYVDRGGNPEPVNGPEDLIYCIYTSGTTGRPKGVMIEHRSLNNYLRTVREKFLGAKGDIPLFTNYAFDLTVTSIWGSVLFGRKLVVFREDAELLRYAAGHDVAVLKAVPTHLMMLLEESEAIGRPRIRRIMLGGEAVTDKILDKIREAVGKEVKVINEYGPTEGTVACSYAFLNRGERITIGKPFYNTRLYVVQDGSLCGIGVPGELCIAGDGVARGYLNQPELTAEKFTADPFGEGRMYHTGDLARWLPDGNVEYLGRIDEQVKIRGFRIELGEIESRIRELGGIRDCAVIAREDAGGDVALHAYVVSDETVDPSVIREELGRTLPDYMIPPYVMQIGQIPVTRNGKLDKRALPEIEIGERAAYEAPESEEEKALCEACEEILGVRRVSVNDSFFEIGGDSIKAIRIVSRMRSKGYAVSVRDIMKYRRPRSIAAFVAKEQAQAYEQGEVTGTVAETPIMRETRLMAFKKPSHFNQAMMIPLEDDVDEGSLRKTLDALVKHHDVLRAVYRDGKLEILGYEESKKYDLFLFDLRGRERAEEIAREESTRIQAGINLEEGPLMRAALFETDQGKQLMVCIHHYAVDGVSWRILREDVDIALNACRNHAEIRLPAKTASFAEWSEALQEYAATEELQKERRFWDRFEERKEQLRLRIPEEAVREKAGHAQKEFSLSKSHTKKLLSGCSKAYNTQVNDLLLAALGMAVKKLTGQDEVAVKMEGHGREPIHRKINIDRTVGWFTTTYPVVVDCKNEAHEAIVAAKEMLREVPNHGRGYGLLYTELLGSHTDVCFNYLGEADGGEEHGGTGKRLSAGESMAAENAMPELLNVNAIVDQKKFVCWVSSDFGSEELLEEMAGRFKEALEAVVDWCSSREKTFVTESDTYALTPLQEGMYFHHKMEDNGGSYVTQKSMKCDRRVDVACLRKSLNALAEKYEVLRTSFAEGRNGEIRQYVDADKEIELRVREYEESFSDDLHQAHAREDVKRGYDLGKDSLMRLCVLRFRDADVLFVSSHHIIEDGWSTPLCCGDMLRFYNLYLNGVSERRVSEMVRNEKQQVMPFRDYVEWIGETDKAETKRYWEEYLEDYESVTEVMPVGDVTERTGSRVEERQVRFDRAMTAKIRDVAARNGATVSTVMQLAVGLLLQKHCGTDDVLFGNVVSGRNVPLQGIEQAMGIFINTIPLRVTLKDKEQTLEERLRELQDSNNKSSAHDHAALGEMKVGKRGASDYVKHLFVFENYPDVRVKTAEGIREQLSVEMIRVEEKTNYALTFVGGFRDEELAFKLAYDPSRYTAEDAGILGEHLKMMVSQIAETPEKKIGDLSSASLEEERRIRKEFNDTAAEYPRDRTVAELFEEQVRKKSTVLAVVYEDQEITYAELNKKANALARKLRSIGVGPDDFVPILAQRSAEMLIGLYAVLKAGGAYVPMDPDYPDERIRYMLEDCRPKAILTYKAEMDVETDAKVLDLEDEKLYEGSTRNLSKVTGPDNLAYCIYTSGTTGRPKGVMIKNRNVVNYVMAKKNTTMTYAYENHLTRFVSVTNMVFDIFVTEAIATMLTGMTVYVANREQQNDLAAFERLVADHQIEILQTTPSRIKGLLAQNGNTTAFKSMKYVMLGGESVGSDVVKRLKEVTGAVIENVYGPSETTVWSTCMPIEKEYRNIPVGKPIANTQVYVVDGGSLCGIGVPGELCIAGDGVARGYLNQSELTAEKFVDNPFGEGRMYHTGDLARWLPDGNVEYLGRMDDQVKVGGFRIELGEIEAKLREISGVKDCAVVVREDARGEKVICAYIVGENENGIQEIRNELGKSLPKYMIPSYMTYIPQIPVNKNGKLDKKALPEISQESSADYDAPINEQEVVLTDEIKGMLNLDTVSRNDDFFEIGGNSMKATILSSHLRERGYEISVREIMSLGIIADIAQRMILNSMEQQQ